MNTEQPIETRCADCRATADEYLDAARQLSAAGRAHTERTEVAVDLLAAEMWRDVARLHDQGAR
jgi:hypothetical protein